MATAQAAAKPMPSPVADAPVGVRAQKLRAAQVRKLPPDRLQPEGHFSMPQRAQVPAGYVFEDVLNPDFWAFVAHRLMSMAKAAGTSSIAGAEIKVVADDLSFCADLMVTGVRVNGQGQADGLFVICVGPCYDPETDTCCPVDAKTGKRWVGRNTA